MSCLAAHRAKTAVAGIVLTLALAGQASAGPMQFIPSRDLTIGSQVIDVQYRQRRVVRRGGGDAAAAAMLGVLALGVGAAIASSQREREYYPSYGYPAYGYPAYGYGYQPAPVYAPPPVYYGDTRWRHRNDGSYWQRRNREERDRMD
jgi:hypothetical protein